MLQKRDRFDCVVSSPSCTTSSLQEIRIRFWSPVPTISAPQASSFHLPLRG